MPVSDLIYLGLPLAGAILGWFLRGKVQPNKGKAAFDAVRKANDERQTRPGHE